MKIRKHHNNYGKQMVKKGKCRKRVKRIAEKLRIPFEKKENEK